MTVVDPTDMHSPMQVFGAQDIGYPPAPSAPSTWDTVKAAVEKSSMTANIVQMKEDEAAFRGAGPPDPTYDPHKDMAGYGDYAQYLYQAHNAHEMELRKGVIDRNRATDSELAATGWKGIAANIAVGVLDPISLATLAVPITGGLRVATTLKGAAAGVATMGTLAAGEEGIYRAAQPARTDMESIYGVTGAALFGGLLGGAAGKFAGARSIIRAGDLEALGKPLVTSTGTHPLIDFPQALADMKTAATTDGSPQALEKLTKISEWEKAGHSPQAIVRAIDEATTPDKVVITPPDPEHAAQDAVVTKLEGADDSVGARRAGDALTLVGGKTTLWAARATPIGRLAQATIDEAQNLGLKLNNTVFRFISKRTGLPEAAPASADTELKRWTIGAITDARRAMKDEFNKYRTRVVSQGEKALSYRDFRNAVGEASRAGGENHPIPEARVAAIAVHQAVYEPLFKQGDKARLFDPFIRSLAHRESAEPYRIYLGQRRTAHKEVRAVYKQAARDSRRALRSTRTTGLQALDKAETEQVAATERAYGWHKAQLQEHASRTLVDRLAAVDDADGAARANVKATTKAEFDDKIKAVETLKKAHQAKIKAHFGVYKKDYAAFAQGVYTNRIAKLRDDAAAALEARLKTVGVTDTVTRKAITDDIHRQLRVAVKQVNQEQTAAEKGVRQQSLKARRELEKQWRKNDREMAQQLDTDLNEIAAGFKDLTPSEFADAVHIATVKDVPDEHISPVMREVMDRVNKVMDSPEFKNYLTRVYNQPKLSADNGAGFIHAVSQYFIGQKVAPDEAKQIATEALNKIQGLGATARIVGMSNRPVTQAAPQLERELAVPDSVIAPWLLNDADSIALSYARSIGSRLELAKISKDYGEPGAWRLGGDRADITQRYAERIRASNPKEAERLKKEHDQVQRDLEATAHRILGIYDLPEDPTRFTTRLANVLKHTNLLSRMGGMMSASFSDVAAPALAMGLSRAYGPALAALAQGQLKAAVKMSARQLQAWGTACEMLTPLWSHAPAELGDIAMPAMQAAGQVFTHMTGISVWNTFGKSLSGVMIQHDLLRLVQRLAGKDLKTLSKSDLNALGDLTRYGIRTDMIDELARQPTQDFGSLKLADTDNWSNPELVNQYRNALVKMVDAFIITPSAGDKFRFIKGPWPGLLAQFQSFAMAAHNKAMVPFMQDPNMVRQATALTAAAFMGAFTYASRMALSGRYDQVDKQIKEKDYYGLARQVVANSSLLTIPSAVENMAGSFLGAQGAGRFASSGTEAMGGPSAGLLDNVWDLGKAVGPNGEYTASTLHKTRNMVPYQNTWVANLLLNPSSGHGLPGLGGEEAIVKKLGLKEKPK